MFGERYSSFGHDSTSRNLHSVEDSIGECEYDDMKLDVEKKVIVMRLPVNSFSHNAKTTVGILSS